MKKMSENIQQMNIDDSIIGQDRNLNIFQMFKKLIENTKY